MDCSLVTCFWQSEVWFLCLFTGYLQALLRVRKYPRFNAWPRWAVSGDVIIWDLISYYRISFQETWLPSFLEINYFSKEFHLWIFRFFFHPVASYLETTLLNSYKTLLKFHLFEAVKFVRSKYYLLIFWLKLRNHFRLDLVIDRFDRETALQPYLEMRRRRVRWVLYQSELFDGWCGHHWGGILQYSFTHQLSKETKQWVRNILMISVLL